MTVYTAIFGKYDDLKEPFVITPGWKYILFTDQDLQSDVWEIRKVPIMSCGVARTARYYKIMFHNHIEDEYSLWIDGTFFINCDLNEWWKQFKEPFTTVSHPFDVCVFKEIQSCIDAGKGTTLRLNKQRRDYKMIPENNGLIASGILMRRKEAKTIKFCEAWWQEVLKYTERDQPAFAYVNYLMPESHHSIAWDYTYMKEFIHIPHLTKRWREGKLNETIEKYGSNQKTKSV